MDCKRGAVKAVLTVQRRVEWNSDRPASAEQQLRSRSQCNVQQRDECDHDCENSEDGLKRVHSFAFHLVFESVDPDRAGLFLNTAHGSSRSTDATRWVWSNTGFGSSVMSST